MVSRRILTPWKGFAACWIASLASNKEQTPEDPHLPGFLLESGRKLTLAKPLNLDQSGK